MDSRALSSWKEIAAHLGVNVRTAQKYERERGLPVRRTTGARGRVIADPAALDAWKATLPAPVPDASERSYRWPLGPNIVAELRIEGATPTPEHLELLRAYLDLAKKALQTTS